VSPAIAAPLTVARTRTLPWISVAVASMLTLLPFVATVPLFPPTGLLLLLAWRLLAPHALKPWAAAPLGLWDDLLSGQPVGSAVLLWSLCFLAIDLIEHRLVYRTFRQDWLIAAAALALCLVGGRYLALPLRVTVAPLLAVQVGIAILAFPLAARLVVVIDRYRGRAG
jgi:rod shape-determining protein MreD